MNLGPLLLCLLTQLAQFKAFFSDLNIVTKEENRRKEGKGQKIKSNLKGLFMYPEMPCLGSLLAKDEDTKVIFIQKSLLVSSLWVFMPNPEALI